MQCIPFQHAILNQVKWNETMAWYDNMSCEEQEKVMSQASSLGKSFRHGAGEGGADRDTVLHTGHPSCHQEERG